MYPIYEHFARDWKHCLDFSDNSLFELYNYESFGRGTISPNNGYAVGKSWMDVTITSWLEDIRRGYLFKHELYEDGQYPHWWLDRILKS